VRHIFKPISYLEIQLLSGVSGGYIREEADREISPYPDSGDTTGVFARCAASIPLSYRRVAYAISHASAFTEDF
ncbi:hypothetical protein, partial [Klebsiella quasipneumoniae]